MRKFLLPAFALLLMVPAAAQDMSGMDMSEMDMGDGMGRMAMSADIDMSKAALGSYPMTR